MKKCAIIAVLMTYLYGCAFHQPNKDVYKFHSGSFFWDQSLSIKRENQFFTATLYPMKNQNSIKNKISRDNLNESETYALDHFLENYDIYLLSIKNKSIENQIFYLKDFKFPITACTKGFIRPHSLPKEINEINLIAIPKNVLLTVGVTVILAVLFALLSLPIPPIYAAKDEREKEIEKKAEDNQKKAYQDFWYPIFIEMKYKYEDMIKDGEEFYSGMEKTGIIFAEKKLSPSCKTGIILKKW